jgi:hypothetical protein
MIAREVNSISQCTWAFGAGQDLEIYFNDTDSSETADEELPHCTSPI